MESFIITSVLGVILVVIGIVNLSGNISTLHSYHRHRVAEEDVKPLGKRVGIGMLICAGGCFANALVSLLYEFIHHDAFVWIGTALLLVGLAIGLFVQLKAIIKYNKGLF